MLHSAQHDMHRRAEMMLRVVFMGSDAIALPLLNSLADQRVAQVTAVFTQPDRETGRGQKVQANAIKLWAQERGLPVHQPEKLAEADLAQLRSHRPDLALVMAYGHILRPNFIEASRLGTLNLHTSLLPKYRGASPIQTAVANGERETGVTLMRIVPELDAGPVADVERVGIEPLDTAQDLEAKLALACVPLVARALPRLEDGSQVFLEQEHAAATFCRKLEKADGSIDFSVPAAPLAARINGLFPWPTCSVEIAGQTVKFGLADATNDHSGRTPGTVLGTDPSGVLVATATGNLRLRKLQRPGGKMLPAADFLRGFPVAPGTVLPSRPMPVLVANKPFPRPKF
jgi:methionyl-tRNA formyltransferase